jgi:hypothetical protein
MHNEASHATLVSKMADFSYFVSVPKISTVITPLAYFALPNRMIPPQMSLLMAGSPA